MDAFFEWLSSTDSPDWAVLAAALVAACVFIALMAVTVISFSIGLWVVPVLIWIVAPSYLLFRAYAGRSKDDT